MKSQKIFFTLLFFLSFFVRNSYAQDALNYNLYTNNPSLYNPAFTGLQNGLFAFVNYHNQWTDFGLAPTVMSFGIQAPMANNFGIGVNLVKDKRAVFTNTTGLVSLSYTLHWSDNQQLRLGLSSGIVNNDFDSEKIMVNDLYDPIYLGSSYRKTGLAAGVGMVYSYQSIEFSAALPQVFDQNNVWRNQVNFGLNYTHSFSPNFEIKPSILVKKHPLFQSIIDCNLMGVWHHKYWANVGYRNNASYIISAGIAYKYLKIEYAYEINTGALFLLSKDSHEIQLSLSLDYLKRSLKSLNIEPLKIDSFLIKQTKSEEPTEPLKEIVNSNFGFLKTSELAGVELVNYTEKLENRKSENVEPIKAYLLEHEPIYFLSGKSILTEKSKAVIDKIATLLKNNLNLRIKINGYTDSKGLVVANTNLSLVRAKVVHTYLISCGIDPKRLSYAGFGQENPITSNETEIGRQTNRRVEFLVY